MTTSAIADLQIATADEMHELGRSLAGLLKAGDLLVLTGLLGAGKTTLTRGIGEGLQAIGNVSSPTFVIARTHKREGTEVNLVHVDAYRLGSPAEFDDLDIDLENSITIVEWGKGLVDDLVESWLEVEIERSSKTAEDAPSAQDTAVEVDDPRAVRIVGFGPRWQGVTL